MSSRIASRPAKSGFIEPCLTTTADQPPSGDRWLHEIKPDGYRLMARRDAGGVPLLTRNGWDWADRYPNIALAVSILRCRSCLIDGEVIILGDDGIATFDVLRRGRKVKPEAVLYCFDLLMLDGDDLRGNAIEERKAALAALIAPTRSHNNVQRDLLRNTLSFADHIEGDGETIFRHACKLGYEGIVSKRTGSHYTSGRSRDWVKSKNPAHPAFTRVLEEDWSN